MSDARPIVTDAPARRWHWSPDVTTLLPAYFGMVMATGIVSLAMGFDFISAMPVVFAVVALIAWAVTVVAYLSNLLRGRRG